MGGRLGQGALVGGACGPCAHALPWRTPHAPERAPTRPAAAPGAPTLRTMAPPTPTRGEVVAVAPQRAAVAGALGSWAGHSGVSRLSSKPEYQISASS